MKCGKTRKLRVCNKSKTYTRNRRKYKIQKLVGGGGPDENNPSSIYKTLSSSIITPVSTFIHDQRRFNEIYNYMRQNIKEIGLTDEINERLIKVQTEWDAAKENDAMNTSVENRKNVLLEYLPTEVLNANESSVRVFGNNVANWVRGQLHSPVVNFNYRKTLEEEEKTRIKETWTDYALQNLFNKLIKLITNKQYAALSNFELEWSNARNAKVTGNFLSRWENIIKKIEEKKKKKMEMEKMEEMKMEDMEHGQSSSPQTAGTYKNKKRVKRNNSRRKIKTHRKHINIILPKR